MASEIKRQPIGQIKEIGGEYMFVESGWYATQIMTKDSNGNWIPGEEFFELGAERDKFFKEGKATFGEAFSAIEERGVGENINMDFENDHMLAYGDLDKP